MFTITFYVKQSDKIIDLCKVKRQQKYGFNAFNIISHTPSIPSRIYMKEVLCSNEIHCYPGFVCLKIKQNLFICQKRKRKLEQ